MNIVLLIDSLHSITAGSERQIYKLAEGLVAANHQVRLILLRHSAFSRQPILFPCPIDCINVNSIASLDACKKMLDLRKKMIAEKVDVVHAYFPDACLLAPLFLKTKHNRIITSRRDMGLIYEGKPAWLYKGLRRRTDVVISNSDAVASLVAQKEALATEQNLVIYNGLESFDFEQTNAAPLFKQPGSIKLLLVANIKIVKRNLDAVIAVHQLLQQGLNVELAIAGELREKDYVTTIQQYMDEHSLTKNIYLLGPIKEPRKILSQADIGLLVSESEGLSNTIMEYMQAGLPVIATNVGGNPELVKHNVNGLLVEKANITQLKESILILAQDKNLRKQFGAAGIKKIEEDFSISAMLNKHEAIYQHR